MRWIACTLYVGMAFLVGSIASAQESAQGWRTPGREHSSGVIDLSAGDRDSGPTAMLVSGEQRPLTTRVTNGSGTLPNSAGQVWREYDIRPYTSHVSTTDNPEQAIIDWILRDTGTDVWFGEPLGILSATHDTLRVYHTPEMQRVVGGIVDRFVGCAGEAHLFGIRVMSIGSPNWRARSIIAMQPVEVQTPGVEAWLVSKEDAAVFVSELSRRSDYREFNSPSLAIQNGQTHEITRSRPQTYAQSVAVRPGVGAGYELIMGQVEEGYSVQLSPLLSVDEELVDAVLKVDIHQIERMIPVTLDLPVSPGAPRQRVQIQVPQVVSWRLHERFRWPTSQVLIVSCGMVAAPAGSNHPLSLTNILSSGSSRADVILVIDSKGAARDAVTGRQVIPSVGGTNFRGRY